MKRLIGICAAIVAASAASACADYGPHGYAQGGGGYAMAVADCGGFYDDFYGPFDDGCWGDDGVFWYRSHDGQYHRDTAGHFSHASVTGMHAVHGTGPGAGVRFGGDQGERPHP